jgi:hypothetical protein
LRGIFIKKIEIINIDIIAAALYPESPEFGQARRKWFSDVINTKIPVLFATVRLTPSASLTQLAGPYQPYVRHAF